MMFSEKYFFSIAGPYLRITDNRDKMAFPPRVDLPAIQVPAHGGDSRDFVIYNEARVYNLPTNWCFIPLD